MSKGLSRLLVGLMVLALPVSAQAVSFDLAGTYHFEDNNATTFAETLVFDAAFVIATDPADPVIGLFDTASMGPLTLSETSYTSGSLYTFDPELYVGGFGLNAGGGVTLTADLTMHPLVVSGTTASSNASLVLNLSNISATGYTAGSSGIVDELLAAGDAAINFTLNTSNTGGFAAVIDQGGGSKDIHGGSFSASVVRVPEPGTVVLMGAGLLGLAFWDRRRRSRADARRGGGCT
jgi:hypothetical protein